MLIITVKVTAIYIFRAHKHCVKFYIAYMLNHTYDKNDLLTGALLFSLTVKKSYYLFPESSLDSSELT